MSDSQDIGGQKKQPSFHAFQVDNGQDGNAYFNKIGAAFEHKDGQGHTVDLKSIPVDGRVVLRTPQERLQEMRSEPDPQPQQEPQQQAQDQQNQQPAPQKREDQGMEH